jgi:hypothetical protein
VPIGSGGFAGLDMLPAPINFISFAASTPASGKRVFRSGGGIKNPIAVFFSPGEFHFTWSKG